MSGQSEGTVYAHAYFSASVESTLQADNFGDIFAGLTSVALTAFMVESYLNYLCEKICDYESRANSFLDDNNPLEIDKKLRELPKNDLSLHVNLAENLGYKNQAEIIIKSLTSSLRKAKREEFELDFNRALSFYELDKKYKLSTKNKLKALLEASNVERSKRDKFLQQFTQLFNARNALAHGRTENVSESFTKDLASEISKSVPTVTASWQESCSIEKAREMYSSAKELVSYFNESFLKEFSPLNNLSSQISAVS
ncbi:hypothetical protein KDW99_06625 [Marinomonas rhizomae]|uniref:hypothetical protein n=1 Tax=Marinomonas rhizomae TaxID=491948 RepID=UPI00210261EC|nr:hypothetical protein [Marinomonas rhizomae]UTW00794.1 hypothetical protein KDW99_06625 [Marinomonas rhizomae]